MRTVRNALLINVAIISLLVPLLVTSQPGALYARSPFKNAAASGKFVRLSRAKLLLNGQQVFRFAGANMHWLALDDYTNYPSQYRVNDALKAAQEMGLTVIRSHSLGISTGCANCVEPSLGVFNKTALEHIDYVIKVAGSLGLKLIIPLTDNWHYPTGGKYNFTDWRGISDENQFYYNAQVISDFETYIATLLNHVNVYTGVAYKDDPAILAWETGNELLPPTSWTQTISTYIKSIDSNHLVMDGRAGVDPNIASLPDVDIVTNHYYPRSISNMNLDALAASSAGKAFVAGEFDWTNSYGGDSLSSFLADALSNQNITGYAFWDMWSHDDQYGYDNGDQYTLHYPGDTSGMRNNVQLLRKYAYRMSNLPLPPYSLPGSPLLETVVQGGTHNTLVWRGATLGASYSIERSTTGPDGPWHIYCNKCATDNSVPWTDSHVPTGPLWYRVAPYNVAGVVGPPSNAYQAGSTGAIIDNLNNWSKTYQHGSHLAFDTSNSQYMRGDTSRVVRTTVTNEFIIWKQTNMLSFQAVAYFWPLEPVSPFSFYTSADGQNWTEATPDVTNIYGDWEEYVYSLQNLTGVNYVKIVWNNLTGQVWNPNLGAVSILH